MQSFTCDPLAEPISPLDGTTMFSLTDDEVSSPLSPSFMCMDDWNRCSSPFSSASGSIPTTPSDSFPNSPCPDGYAPYLEAFEHSFAKSFGEFPAYPNGTNSHFTGRQFSDPNTPDLSTGYSFPPSFEQDHSKTHMATQDLVFSAFMASLPDYSL